MPPSCWKVSLVPAFSSLKTMVRPLCRKALASRRKRIVSAENSCLPKISGSGRKVIDVPVPRAGPTLRSLVTALPRSYFCSHSAPSRLISAVSCFGQGVDDRRADAVQAARELVLRARELAARVQRGQHQLQRRLLVLLLDVDGDAAPVVGHGHRLAVGVQRDVDARAVPVDDLVDAVVDDLPQQVVVALAVGAPDVHAGALAHRLEPLEDGDVFGRVAAGRHVSSAGAAGWWAAAARRARSWSCA